MRYSTRAAAVAAAVVAATAAFAGPASAHSSGAVFVQTNGLDGNAIVAYDAGLHRTGTYPTGGHGGLETGAEADPLASQGSLTLDRARNRLYAVNAGSDTVTVFGVHGTRLTRLQVVGSGGSFPVSVTVRGDLVYVLNARDGGSVQGFRTVGGRLVRIPAGHRALGLDPQAAPEFTHSPGQVSFTPDGRRLLVTTKGNTSEILSYAVGAAGDLAARPVRNAEPDAVPFAITYDRYGHAVVAEAGSNAGATFDVRHDGTLAGRATAATGGTAVCWVTGVNGVFYFSNTGSGSITAFRTGADGSLRNLGTTATAAGPIDTAASADGGTLYVQTGAGTDAVSAFRVGRSGALTPAVSATIPGGSNSQGIAAY